MTKESFMTKGVGGYTQEDALDALVPPGGEASPITTAEYRSRIDKVQRLMKAEGIDALYVNAGTNLYYFTGTRWYPSERMVGAIIPAEGKMVYIAPYFEISTIEDFMHIEGDVNGWQEHENPYQLFVKLLSQMGIRSGRIAIDEATPFFIVNGIQESSSGLVLVNGSIVTAACRMIKTPSEIALLQRAKEMTLEVHKAAARILTPGISTTEVTDFINKAHQKAGARGSSFCIVLFGVASSFPHGVKEPQQLKENDVVLIDTGCLVEGYHSDITRTYVFGEANSRQREVWDAEKAAQLAAFDAAKLGAPCGSVDMASRKMLEQRGFGPDYDLPGLPHRTGHGIGLDIHEWPYLVKSDQTPLQAGMCFSNEPMIVVPGEFGVRLEDHFYMTDQGPKWFTQPSASIDDPFGA